ncbi:hypothetical protein Sme01_30830 [Sphaerisporangium melleum]|uniref:Uncharacterized protein n=1 Tax=Sphaerisporangium melleum TaxID=321316 RepID=A0A917R8L6_9ACTN|nr:hypothetical protein [Sphaerisporangium melleum]GGK95455.1 hypothetical protein GCM10007964_42260 [Sphaerisporangium melleum]GII70607.1 hypothetical protein Sme01_30830 [Sphaerisporangium melleum]
MGRKAHIDREELGRLVASGWSNARLAAHFGVTESGILQAKRSVGLARPMLDHSRAIPWKLNRVHNQTGPATNLRNLSTVAQGGEMAQTKINTALRWARRLVDNGLDVSYRPELGFYETPVTGNSHVESVLGDALEALERREKEQASGDG